MEQLKPTFSSSQLQIDQSKKELLRKSEDSQKTIHKLDLDTLILRKAAAEPTDDYQLFDDLLQANVHLSLDKLLNIVPNFKQHIIAKYKVCSGADKQAVDVDAVQPQQTVVEDVDFRVPVVQVEFAGQVLNEVLLDGGLGESIFCQHQCILN